MLPQNLFEKIEKNKKIINRINIIGTTLIETIREFYRVEMNYNSNAIEGYGCSLAETEIIIKKDMSVRGRYLRDVFAVYGLNKAYDYMFYLLDKDIIEEKDILSMHEFLAPSLDNNSKSGEYRKFPVYITGSKYPVTVPEKIISEMNKFFLYVKEAKELNPIVLAANVHKYLAFIHPFGDGNGRIARLAMNTILLQRGYTPIVIPVSKKQEYFQTLEESRRNDVNFVKFLAECEYENQKDFIRTYSF